MAAEGNPFFGEGKATAVSPLRREEIATGPPCVLVSSSGMLTGGPSSFYASWLVKDPKSAILITGYQDEESPGRALLNLAEVRAQGKVGHLTGGEARSWMLSVRWDVTGFRPTPMRDRWRVW